jgi:flavin reductase (DIM6/NTAB) family NADH-FMN oxidoreductase RutF
MTIKTEINTADLRKALGTFATGVTIVTTLDKDKNRIGVTVNSFSSVSLEPPIVLWSLKKSSLNVAAFDHSGRFVINVLAQTQVNLSQRFASSIQDKFSSVEFREGLGGLPMIENCVASFQCMTYQRIEAGDHILYLGEVNEYARADYPTLIFCKGKYMSGQEIEAI